MYSSGHYQRKFEIDMSSHPVVVFESDDWGACEGAANEECLRRKRKIADSLGFHDISYESSRLESRVDLDCLFQVLERFQDRDGVRPVFTAYTCMGNPDYDRIRKNDFTAYYDVDVNDGFPGAWNRRDIVEGWLKGVEKGVWAPEYHALLHHTSPRLWMDALRSSPDSLARRLFDIECYYQFQHVPEYDGYNIREQMEMIQTGFQRFQKLFGRKPNAVVTSDAYPETEMLWSVAGARTVALKNCRNNNGEVVVYDTKPWNMQDVYAKIGDYHPMLDVVYLSRNVFFEPDSSFDGALRSVRRNWLVYGEPAVISTHRLCYCSWQPEKDEHARQRLAEFLQKLVNMGAVFLSSGELGDLYRQGWSERRIGDRILWRRWAEKAELPDDKKDRPVGTHWLQVGE